MENLKMHTPDLAEENYRKLAELFPNAVTETITGYDEDGKAIIERAIDADVLRQEIAAQVVEGSQERYQFTWPDKKRSVVLANQPIAKTLRLVREKSVGRDGTPGFTQHHEPPLCLWSLSSQGVASVLLIFFHVCCVSG